MRKYFYCALDRKLNFKNPYRQILQKYFRTSMQSSRMSTICLSTVSCSIWRVCLPGVVCFGECPPRRGVCLGEWLPRGNLNRGRSALGVVCQGCVPRRGVCPEDSTQSCNATDNPTMWTEWLTDRCKNFTLPKLRLQVVISQKCVLFLYGAIESIMVVHENFFFLKFNQNLLSEAQ